MNGEPVNKLHGFDKSALWERFCVVDVNAGEIVILTPITAGRVRDTTRDTKYFSSITVGFGGVGQNVQFEIPATSLEDALDKWIGCAEAASREFFERQRSEAFKRSLTRPAAARIPPVSSH